MKVTVTTKNMLRIWIGGFISIAEAIIKILTLGIVRFPWSYKWTTYSAFRKRG